jgi:subtilisin family serine protease
MFKWRDLASALVGLATVIVPSGCADQGVPAPHVLGGTPSLAVTAATGRRATAWREMSRAQLGAKVAEAGGRVFIGFKDPKATAGVDERGRNLAQGNTVAAAKASLRALDAELEFEFTDLPIVVARIPAGGLATLLDDPRIEYVEPIFPGRRGSQTTPWNVSRVNAPSVWSSATGSGATVYVIDSGIDASLADQDGATGIGTCMPSPDQGYDIDGHGTNVAGVISALNNTSYGVGVAPGVRLFSLKDGNSTPDPAYTACGVQAARAGGAEAINISSNFDPAYTALTDQINAAWNQDGIIVVAAVGNDEGGAVGYPASLPNVIAVSGTDFSDGWYAFSNVGSKVEIAAPGSGVQTMCLGQSTCTVSGTSFAAPHVAAAAALLKTYNPYWSFLEIRRRLGAGATDLGSTGRDNYFGYGLLSITGAIAAAPLTLQVSIGGPTSHPSSHTAEFSALPIDGLPPYVQYTWKVDGIVMQQSSSATFSWSSSTDYTVSVIVEDSAAATASNSLGVTVCQGVFQC